MSLKNPIIISMFYGMTRVRRKKLVGVTERRIFSISMKWRKKDNQILKTSKNPN
jgi:hypothetical protein